MPWRNRSNQSMGLTSLPLKSICSFSTICGGANGASPNVRQMIIKVPQESLASICSIGDYNTPLCRYNVIVMEIVPGPQWQALLSVITKLGRGAAMIMGTTDSGKSTLARYLITQLLAEGITVSLVDTDVGQTSLGLPGTISLKAFSSERDLANFAPDRMFFVGAVNPATRIPLIIRMAGRAVTECRRKSDLVLIDTSGLVSGRIGEALKTAKTRAIRPERIIAVQKADEIEHILKLTGDVDISRLAASGMVKSRGMAARVRYRERKYEDYFRENQPMEYLVHMQEAEFFYNDKTMSPKNGFPRGNIVGLNRDEETLALGILTETSDDWITFRSPLKSIKKINRIVFGDITFVI